MDASREIELYLEKQLKRPIVKLILWIAGILASAVFYLVIHTWSQLEAKIDKIDSERKSDVAQFQAELKEQRTLIYQLLMELTRGKKVTMTLDSATIRDLIKQSTFIMKGAGGQILDEDFDIRTPSAAIERASIPVTIESRPQIIHQPEPSP